MHVFFKLKLYYQFCDDNRQNFLFPQCRDASQSHPQRSSNEISLQKVKFVANLNKLIRSSNFLRLLSFISLFQLSSSSSTRVLLLKFFLLFNINFSLPLQRMKSEIYTTTSQNHLTNFLSFTN